MPKYWEKQIFTNGSFPQSGSKAKGGEKKKERKILQGLGVARVAMTESWP